SRNDKWLQNVARSNVDVFQIYKLLQYIREKDKAQIKKMVSIGICGLINLTEPKDGLSALYQATLDGDEDLVELLLSLKAHPDIQDKKGCSPLMLAAKLAYYKIVHLLIQNHADIELKDKDGKGVLFYCIFPSTEHSVCLKMVLSSKGNVDIVSKSGKPLISSKRSALMEAASAGAVKLVRTILQKGGDPNLLDKEGRCATHFAAEGGFLEVLQVLSAYSTDFNISSLKGNTPLHLAAAGGFSDCCRFLAQRGCNPKLKNQEGLLASQVAKSNGRTAALKELKKAEKILAKFSSPDSVNPNELWAVTLHDWSYENQIALRQAFQTPEELDESPEKISVEAFVFVLGSYKAPVSDQNLQNIIKEHDKNLEGVINLNEFFSGLKYLQKPFVTSSYAPKPPKKGKGGKDKKKGKCLPPLPICTMPVERMPKRQDNGLPYHMIESFQPFVDFKREQATVHPIKNDLAWYLEDPEKIYTNINYCVRSGDLESLRLAFTSKVPVDIKDHFFKTPLTTACSCGSYKVAEFLISLGADVNAVDQFYWTPLHHACHAGHMDVVNLLIQSGAMVNAVALNGATPLMRAIESCRFACVEYLLKAGAKVAAENKQGQNCLDIAMVYSDARIVGLVMSKFKTPQKGKDGGKGSQK
ncbi:hypothetical protein DNTS_015227, partial [Danionella cerebrum]